MLKMKPLALAFTVAAAAFGAQNASAVAPGACAAPGVVDVYLTGASAPQAILGNIFQNLLNPGFTVVYSKSVGSVSAGTDYRAYCGTLINAVGTIPAGSAVRFINRAKGGSLWGVNPVARKTKIATLSFADANCNAAGGSGRNFDCSEVGNDLDETNADNLKPDFGVSDVEPRMFAITANLADAPTAVSTALTQAELDKLNPIHRGFQVLFGVVATDTLVEPTATFTRGNLAQILTGQSSRWNTLFGGKGSNTYTNDRIVICRREPGSGTQASSNQYFLDQPCAQGNVANSVTLTPSRQTSPNGGGNGAQATPFVINPAAGLGPVVIEASTSGEVRNCMLSARNGTDFTFQAPNGNFYQVKFGGNTWGAIGVLSMENQNNAVGIGTAAGATMSFRSINGQPLGGFLTGDAGAKPARDAAQVGAYDFVMENTFQLNADDVADAAFATKLAFINAFLDLAQKESTLRSLGNANETSVLAIPGIAGNTTTATVPTALDTANAGTSRWTKNANTCSPIRSTR